MVVHQPHEQTDDADEPRQLIAEIVQLLLQRRVLRLLGRLLDLRLNLTNLRLHAHVDDVRHARALGHGRAAEEHALLRLKFAIGVRHRVRGLPHAHGFARERGLIDANRRGFQSGDSAIGGDAISGAHLDDVAGDELARGEVVAPLAVAEAPRGLGLHLLERLEGGLGVGFLPDADDGVEDEDEEDDAGLDEIDDGDLDAGGALLGEGDDEGDDRGEEEDLDEGVVELLQDQLPEGLALLLVELVVAVDGARGGDLRGGQAGVGIQSVLFGHGVRGHRPRRGGLRLGRLGTGGAGHRV